MKVFLAVKSLLPSYGGPAFSVSQLAHALAKAGVQVGLWASDVSASMDSALVPSHSSVRLLNSSIIDAIDLLPWAMCHKGWKKKVAWWLYQHGDLCRAAFIHTTAESEAEDLRQLELGVPVGVIPNGVEIPDLHREHGTRIDISTAMFLGRIHPIKGLSRLIEAWAELRPRGWQLQIAGPDEVGYRAELERMVSVASLSNVVHFLGPLDRDTKEHAFANADLFVLPSHSESFGMVIGEALAHAVPVLTTTGVPWPMIEERGCGWSVNATVDGIREGLRVATSSDPAALRAMGEKGREFVRREFAWTHIARRFIDTYEMLLMRSSWN
jgi:glycosyltransferase involved in cell wall biosynthesis